MFTILTFIVLLNITFIIVSAGEQCLLDEMITIKKNLCNFDNKICDTKNINKVRKSRHANNYHQNLSYVKIPLLKPGSPSLSHFQTVLGQNNRFSYRMFVGTFNTLCNETDYRSFDGSCNNLQNPNWGEANSEMIRLLLPNYSGPKGEIAKSVSGSDLPLPRLISLKLFKDELKPVKKFTLAVMQWGQLITHDIVKSPSKFSVPVDCCAVKEEDSALFPYCYPIKFPKNDPFYEQFNQTCSNMIRTHYIWKKVNCSLVPYQISSVSHNLDCSELYGSSNEVCASLRTFNSGLLDVYVKHNQEYLKLSEDTLADCNVLSNETCFHSGDSRVNQNIQLTCLQTILLREHNRIARKLTLLNPQWNDEKLFQEARRILIAEYQHITYNEYLPMLLGKVYTKKYNLNPLSRGYTTYNPKINFATINSFAASAHRILHSQIQGQISLYSPITLCPYQSLNFSDYMNRPGLILEQDINFDALLLGLFNESVQNVDQFFTKQITDYMFHGRLPYGEDLESFDIQRGRDHGIRGYNDFRELCGRERAKIFDDLIGDIPENVVKFLRELYVSVDDIDFFVGAAVENLVEDTLVGPTALCIIGEQFLRKKLGDRFWYEHGKSTHSFTEEQLTEIRKISFSKLICNNGNNFIKIQPKGFVSSLHPGNEVVPCENIPDLDISKWKELK